MPERFDDGRGRLACGVADKQVELLESAGHAQPFLEKMP
jgi:hypothetical protein